MTQEEKQLLLKDLCARLPYGVKVCVDDCICALLDISTEMGDKLNGKTFHTAGFNKSNGHYDFCAISEVKPYLRPMSSMTEDERLELSRLSNDKFKFYLYTMKPEIICYEKYNYFEGVNVLDWLNAHYFDYHGLIPMGLALEAPEGMYNRKRM